MNIKEQLRTSWTFAVAVGIFILLTVLSTTRIYDVSNIFFGVAKILLAVTITYTCVKVSKSFHKKGKYSTSTLFTYGAGLLSGLWLYDAIQYLF